MRAASTVAALGFAAASHAGPVVTCENFNELGNVYQATLRDTSLTGLPTGISANFNWHCQLMWSPGVNPAQTGWRPNNEINVAAALGLKDSLLDIQKEKQAKHPR